MTANRPICLPCDSLLQGGLFNPNPHSCSSAMAVCSSGADGGATAPIQPAAPGRRPQCYKCKSAPALYFIRQSAACGACFDENVFHKLKTGLRHCRVLSHGPPVSVAVSGGASSLALLRGFHAACVGVGRARFMVEGNVVHIDETALAELMPPFPDGVAPRDRVSAVLRACTEVPYPTYCVPLELVFHLESGRPFEFSPHPAVDAAHVATVDPADAESHRARLCDLFSAVGTRPDARHELLRSLRLRLLRAVVSQLGSATVLLGTSADRCATSMLGSVSCGRGASLASEMAFRDDRFAGPAVARPARDLLLKELALYLRRRRVSPIPLPTFLTGLAPRRSVHDATARLVDTLQTSFPSTVPTVMRTAQRLRTPSAAELSARAGDPDSGAELPRCPLCGGAWDGAAAVEGAPHYAQMRRGGDSDGAGPLALLRAAACHGCRSSLDDSALSAPASLKAEAHLLPGPVTEEARSVRRWMRERMRDAVDEFLLPGADDDDPGDE